MPLERGCVLIQIRESGRDLLRKLAWRREKPMYEVVEDVIREAFERDEKRIALALAHEDYVQYVDIAQQQESTDGSSNH